MSADVARGAHDPARMTTCVLRHESAILDNGAVNDTVPLTGWLEPMLVALERDFKVGVVGSRLLYPRLGLVQHAGIEIDGRGLPFHRYRLDPSEAPEVNEDRILLAMTGACLLVRRALFETLKGFYVGFRNGYEDVDLCLRAQSGIPHTVLQPEHITALRVGL